MPLLTVNNLSFSYADNALLKGVTLEFRHAQLAALIGPNGAGKSTLLRLLMAMLPVHKGDISLQGKNIHTYKKQQLARLITLVPQDARIAYPFSVEEIVAMGRNPWLGRFHTLSDYDRHLIDSALQKTDILHLKHRSVNQLSGGERQRVLIARAVAQQTPIILLDEATANLDICHQLETLTLAQQLSREGRLVIAAIHDLNMASRFCDRLILLARQGIQADSIPDNVLTVGNLKRYFQLHAEIDRATRHKGISIHAVEAIKSVS